MTLPPEHRLQRESWDRIADGWAEWVRTNQARVHVLDAAHLALVGSIDGLRVLDAGCGEGRFARMLAERGAVVTGIDLAPRMIEIARETEAANPLGVKYHLADMADLSSFEAGSFDLAVAYVSLVDVPAYEQAMTEIARVLRPAGRFLFSIVHPCFCPPGAAWEPRKPDMIPIRDVDKLYKKIDNYFPPAEIRFRMWPTAPAETVNYHRPLSHYARAVRDAGLAIRDIDEPTPDPALAEERDYLREWFRAPPFIIFDCVKAALP
jgi:2-polyprenyl-3-methyl-5-hydroxy-6-metoxy-1,4-benzoquinol methylase